MIPVAAGTGAVQQAATMMTDIAGAVANSTGPASTTPASTTPASKTPGR